MTTQHTNKELLKLSEAATLANEKLAACDRLQDVEELAKAALLADGAYSEAACNEVPRLARENAELEKVNDILTGAASTRQNKINAQQAHIDALKSKLEQAEQAARDARNDGQSAGYDYGYLDGLKDAAEAARKCKSGLGAEAAILQLKTQRAQSGETEKE